LGAEEGTGGEWRGAASEADECGRWWWREGEATGDKDTNGTSEAEQTAYNGIVESIHGVENGGLDE